MPLECAWIRINRVNKVKDGIKNSCKYIADKDCERPNCNGNDAKQKNVQTFKMNEPENEKVTSYNWYR